MQTILHGDDEVQIHKELSRLVDQAKKKGIQLVQIEAKSITLPELESILGTQELFASEKLVVIDRLHSLPKSKFKDELTEWLGKQESDSIHVVLVENKTLTPVQLKKFPNAHVTVLKLPTILFSFVETLGIESPSSLVTMFHKILVTQEPEFVFTMIVRQVRILIAYVADGVYDGPPFGRQKVQRQARAFTLDRLLRLHRRLLAIDFRQKTSRNSLSLVQEIDLFLTED